MTRWLAFTVLALAQGMGLHAQDSARDDLMTIHSYANLIQLPTLVLDRWGEPVAERPGQRFMISLDHGKPFRATHVRLQGEDPISLAIVIDASGSQSEVVYGLPAALARLAPLSLTPRDHVSVYALDCSVVRTLNDRPADPQSLKASVLLALDAGGLHGPTPRGNCGSRLRLRDALLAVTNSMRELPGRRVLLAVTDGRDRASGHTWDELQNAAQHAGVAIFGLRWQQPDRGASSAPGRMMPATTVNEMLEVDRFDATCQSSGGRIFPTDGAPFPALRSLLKALRGRYIVQFSRPPAMEAGQHGIEVTVAGQQYQIRPAGASVPIADEKEIAAHALSSPDQAPPPDPPPPPDQVSPGQPPTQKQPPPPDQAPPPDEVPPDQPKQMQSPDRVSRNR